MTRGAWIFVDWGTTNRRAYLVNDGRIVNTLHDERGIRQIEGREWRDELDGIRSQFEAPDACVLMGGMIGSAGGWVETRYIRCPAGPRESAAGVHWLTPGKVGILPGLASPPEAPSDVMRGEEPQVFGAVALGLVPPSALVCQPGTHNKWIRLKEGRIASFRTVMTGEMFALIRQHSILAPSLAEHPREGEWFQRGVERGLAQTALLSEIFRLRAELVLGEVPPSELSSLTSGLLIGSDVRFGLADQDDHGIYVVGEQPLRALYAAALGRAGRTAIEIDSSATFVPGMQEVVRLWS
jgi:2-dehydro-3-deoxygalactonokinase